MSTQSQLEAAYILHRRPYKESSFILDVLTMDSGRIALVSKGNRGKNASNVASLQVFQPLLVSWSGKGELKSLRQFEIPSPAISLYGVALYSGYYLNELMLYLTPPSMCVQEMFVSYASALEQLSTQDLESSNLERVLRSFELHLLKSLGALPELTIDFMGNEIDTSQNYRLEGDGFVNVMLDLGGHNRIEESSLVYSGDTLLNCAAILDQDSCEIDRIAVKRFTRHMIDSLLSGRELRSRQLLKDILRLRKS